MTTVPMSPSDMTPVKRALLEIRDLKARLAEADAARHEPMAIVGMAMRLPGGVRDAAGFATLLWQGVDAIGAIPAERWPVEALYAADADTPGKTTTRHGGFIDGVDAFDAEFFGISPREAASMDPQQRLLLQLGWEALEDAGRAGADLAGSRCGVYVGISNNDYGRALYGHRELIDAYFGTGNAFSVAAGRLSYFLGVHGPSVAVDTACSSSLAALHQASQALRLQECDMALVGAVNLVLTPEMNINFSRARMMAADGRCKTFDAAADGYGRGEGCAMLVLRRLSDALADGDRVHAVVRGSALNQDGRSGGLTAPNGPAQEAVLRAALAAARVTPDLVGYVEAHGTGTPLGDPIEVGALQAVYGAGRPDDGRLLIGSVKTNIGHLEAAAGLAGVIKVVLALQRREIPPHLHFRDPSPHIDWAGSKVAVPTAATPWADIRGRRLAGVSSFGFSGTNAHAILEEAPAHAPADATTPSPLHLLTVSARDPRALEALRLRYLETLAEPSDPIADVCFTAAVGRTHFAHRLAVTGATHDELRRRLAEARPAHAGPAARPKVAFLFTGQGAQFAGMGRTLYATSAVFRERLDACAAVLRPLLGIDLIELLATPESTSSVDTTAHAPIVTYAVQVGLAALWRSWGVAPAAVMGHSLGEYAAACDAGLMTIEAGIALVAERGRLTGTLPSDGGMAAVFAPEAVVRAELARHGDALGIAAYNGPEHLVISGARTELADAVERFERRGIRVRRLRVQHAAHSRFVEPVLPRFRTALERVAFGTPHTALVSNVSGRVAEASEVGTPDYWIAHMREPVRFVDGMRTLVDRGITHFIEIGPHPVLLGMGAECPGADGAAWLPSLHRERPDWTDLLEGVETLFRAGADIDWTGFHAGRGARRVALPTYPFQTRRHWMDVVGGAPNEEQGSAARRWRELAAALQRQAERGPLDLNAASYPAKWALLERLTNAHAARTLRGWGLFAAPGERRTLDEVLARGVVPSTYAHLVGRWLERLTVEGGLHREDDGSVVAREPLPVPDLAALLREADAAFADNRPLLDYVRHCGELLVDVLAGTQSPLETLFPGGGFALAEGLYERSATMRYSNELAASAFAALAASVPPRGVLRVLEVGGGTGGTTAALLPTLPADRTRYRFTDVSGFFFERARSRFAAYPFVDCSVLDLDADLQAQGYEPGSFDVIVAANAVHAVRDLRRALDRLHRLLAPGGVLVLVESTVHLAWFDMTTGLIEGWQQFADDLRTDNPLLPAPVWVEALRQAGFASAASWPEAGSPAEVLGQHLIVGQAAGDAPSTVRLLEPVALAAPADDARPVDATPANSDADPVRARLAEALPDERIAVLRDHVRAHVVQVLRLDADQSPGLHDRLMDLGFDSLMAVQLRNRLGTGLGLDKPLPATLMFDHPTIDALAAFLLDRLEPPRAVAEPAPAAPAVAPPPAAIAADVVAAMTDADIEALLMKHLAATP